MNKPALIKGKYPLNNTTVDDETEAIIIDHKCSICGSIMDDGITRVFNMTKPNEPFYKIKFRDLICRSCHTTSVAVTGKLAKEHADG